MTYLLFRSPMAEAIAAGRKTQTRRLVDTGNWNIVDRMTPEEWISSGPCGLAPKPPFFLFRKKDEGSAGVAFRCPYGQPGDLIWVRERWRVIGWMEGEPELIEYADGATREVDPEFYEERSVRAEEWSMRVTEQCSDDCEKAGLKVDDDYNYVFDAEQGPVTRWRPSIHMPRWCARTWLCLTDVTVERLRDISEEDAKAEGVCKDDCTHPKCVADDHIGHRYKGAFAVLWNSLGGPTWDDNPLVWKLTFEKVT